MAQADIPPEASKGFPPGKALIEDIYDSVMRPIYDFFDYPYPPDDSAPGTKEKR